MITRDKDGAVTREEYWRDGVQIPAEQIREKKEKESVALIEKLTRELSADRDKIASLTAQVTALTEKINKIKAILE
jgi:N-methylhydantoinase B/oxoprolinase/acetone carboxylase alpha subunit